MVWTVDKIDKLRQLWGKGNTANQIAQIIGDVTRNAVIGKANRLNLSNKLSPKSTINNSKVYFSDWCISGLDKKQSECHDFISENQNCALRCTPC